MPAYRHLVGQPAAAVKSAVADIRLALRRRALQLGRDALGRLDAIVHDPSTLPRDAINAATVILRVGGLIAAGDRPEDETAKNRFHELIVALRTPRDDSVRPTPTMNDAVDRDGVDAVASAEALGGGDTGSPPQAVDDLDASTRFSPPSTGMERIVDIDEDGNVIATEDVYAVTRRDDGVRIVDLGPDRALESLGTDGPPR